MRPRRLRKVAAAPRTSYSVIADVLVKLGFKRGMVTEPGRLIGWGVFGMLAGSMVPLWDQTTTGKGVLLVVLLAATLITALFAGLEALIQGLRGGGSSFRWSRRGKRRQIHDPERPRVRSMFRMMARPEGFGPTTY